MTALRIAVPNKGSLALPAASLLADAGYRQRAEARDLMLLDPANDVEFFFLRPRDIAVYVGSGTLDVGFTGRDLLLDSRADAEEVMSLGFAGSTFRFAARPADIAAVAELDGRRIATSYPGLVEDHLAELGIKASVVRLDGAVESAVSLGVADAIADVVRDRGDHAQCRAGGLRRADPAVGGGADPARRRARGHRGRRGLRRPVPAAAGSAHRPGLRDDRLRLPGRRPGRRLRDHPRHRVPDGVPARPPGLGRRAVARAAGPGAVPHGRAVGRRRPRDPADPAGKPAGCDRRTSGERRDRGGTPGARGGPRW